MNRSIAVTVIPFALILAGAFALRAAAQTGPPQPDAGYGWILAQSTDKACLWWTFSGWKIGRTWAVPADARDAVSIRAARNEADAAQIVVRPKAPLKGFRAEADPLKGPEGAVIPKDRVDVLRVRYVNIDQPSDRSGTPGPWPDPLPPFKGPIDLEAGMNHPLWVRVAVPRDARAGVYHGHIRLAAEGFEARVPLRVEVYAFTLPDRMTCTSAFGFSPGNVWRYQNIPDEARRRAALEKYWASFSAHRISPYDPAPLDPIADDWPEVKPRPRKWEGGRYVINETHRGIGALAVFDDDRRSATQSAYRDLIPIPEGGLHLTLWHRTALPGHRFLVTLNHHDQEGKWMWGRNLDLTVRGDGTWQRFERRITAFPDGARSVRLILRPACWTEEGELTGLVWFDEVSVKAIADGRELIEDGGFEDLIPFEPVDPARLTPTLDFSAWDRAVSRGLDHYHFNSLRVTIPGMGGGTFHAIHEPVLLGYPENTDPYWTAFQGYVSRLEAHLEERGWLDASYVYWFDEPSPDQYAFVKRGFEKLEYACPGIGRMLTEQVEPELIGGPDIWCCLSSQYDHERAEERRKHGERFWWYVCTGPKAPYAGLFIDHAGTEMRVWLWQTFQRSIEGILVWQTNYWTSDAAYPDPDRPQNPYEDPMGWTSGYSTPAGVRRAWGNGDGRFLYPPEAAADGRPAEPVLDGPVDSIRWEMLRDGVEDYEYLVMLRQGIERGGAKLRPAEREAFTALLKVPPEITESLTVFAKDPAPIEARRHEIARAIEALEGGSR